MATNKGEAHAVRTGGNTYSVTYERGVAADRDVSGEYLNGLVRSGYTVHCDNGGYDAPEVGRLVAGEVKWTPKS